MESRRKNFDEKIKKLKFEIKTLFTEITYLKKDKEDLEYSKHTLENNLIYNEDDEKLLKKMSSYNKRPEKLSELDFEKLNMFKRILEV